MNDLYEILGVSRGATPEQIKAAYRVFSKKHHPDKGGEKEAFQRGQHAFEVLSDPGKRQSYDLTGDAGYARDHQTQLMQLIRDVIEAVISRQGERGNIVNEAKKQMRSTAKDFDRQAAHYETEMQRAKRLKSRIRFKPKNGEADVVGMLFDAKIAAAERSITVARTSAALAAECVVCLDAWEDAGGPESLYWSPVYGDDPKRVTLSDILNGR